MAQPACARLLGAHRRAEAAAGAAGLARGACQSIVAARMIGFDDRVDHVCRLVDDPRRPDPAAGPAPVTSEKARQSFLTRVHIDGLWTTTQDGARFYGIIGSHISLVDVGRVQVFGPPGVMLLTVPDGHGGRRVSLGYTWGVSLRLADVGIGTPNRNLTLFLNVTKLFGARRRDGSPGPQGYNIVGFSLAPRKDR